MNLEKNIAKDIEENLTLRDSNRIAKVSNSLQAYSLPQSSVLEDFKANINKLERLTSRLDFMMSEVKTLIVRK